ncbi:MAG: 6-pyruvoyl-tetrahydropterin synthase-related protein [bacterium]|nr:6-pyruvoyl-tetrahydropterin synthase-related protein [bacterium]
MPSWAAELNATYGNPLFIFNYSLPYYIVSFFHFLGISFISSMKIYLGLTLYLSGIFMYLWIKELLGNKLAAFTSAIFYIFNPYHLIDVHFRATLGESTIFTLVPLLLYLLTKYIKEKKFIYLISIALASQLLFLAHPMIAGVFIGIACLYIMLMINIKKNFKKAFVAITFIIIGIIGASYSWFSFILFSPYVLPQPGGMFFQDTFSTLLYSPWRYGLLFQGNYGELAYIIGYTQIIVLIIAAFIFIKKNISKKLKSQYLFWLLIFFIVLFFMSPYSKCIWLQFPFLSMLQSNRLLLPIALCTSALAGYLAIYFSETRKKKIFIYLLIIITIGYTILNWGHRRVIPEINDSDLRKNVWISTVTEGPTAYFLSTKWTNIENLWFSEKPKMPLEIIQGTASVQQTRRTSIQHDYVVDAKTQITIKENTLYFPGWSLQSNNKSISIYPGERGVINAKLPQGLQQLKFSYEDIPLYKISKIISSGIILALVVFIFANAILKKYKRR